MKAIAAVFYLTVMSAFAQPMDGSDQEMKVLEAYGNGDYPKVVQLAQAPAAKRSPRVQFILGSLYTEGMGVAKNGLEGRKWFEASAKGLRRLSDAGDSEAQGNLAYLYIKGYGVKKNYQEAARLARESALKGHPAGMNNLGDCYEHGNGVAKDLVEAYRWYLLAEAQGFSISKEDRLKMESNMTPAQIADAKQKAVYMARYNKWNVPNP